MGCIQNLQLSLFIGSLATSHILFDKPNGFTDLELELVTFVSHVSDLKKKTFQFQLSVFQI